MTVAWHGVFPAATTQFQSDQALDLPATMGHIDKMIEAGIHNRTLCRDSAATRISRSRAPV